MKTYNINIDTKYFEPIRDGQIRLLIFDKKCTEYVNGETAEVIAQNGPYSVKANIDKVYVKSFSEITEEEAISAGFLNKKFLKDELIHRFKLDSLDVLLNDIGGYLFYLIEISPQKENTQKKENGLFYYTLADRDSISYSDKNRRKYYDTF